MAMFESCPRCRATIRIGQLVCARCGLRLDDNRLEAAPAQPQQVATATATATVTPPIAQKKRLRRRDRAAASLIAGLALLALTVAVGMAQTKVSNPTNSIGQASLATQTSTRAAISNIINVQVSSTPPPPTATTRPARTPIQIPTVTTVAVLPTSTSAPPSPVAPTVEMTRTPDRPQLTSTPVIGTPTRPIPPSPRLVPPTPTAKASKPSPTAVPPTPKDTGASKELNGWTIALGKVESRDEVTTTQPDVRYVPAGKFWLVYVDARNNGNSPRSVGQTLDFSLTDDKGTIYLERSERGNHPGVREFARVFGRDYLDKEVAPGEVTRTMLVFVMPVSSQPRTLTVRAIGPDGKVSNTSRVRFDIPQNSPRLVPPTPTAKASRPSPTAVPPTSRDIGASKEFNGWTIALGKVESRDEITTTQPDVKYVPAGKFWLVYVDARNNGNSPRSVGQTLDFSLTDDKGTIYLERSERGNHPGVREFARVFGRDYLNKEVAPGEVTRTMLVFVMPVSSQPRTLTVRAIGPDGKVSNASHVRFDIPQNR